MSIAINPASISRRSFTRTIGACLGGALAGLPNLLSSPADAEANKVKSSSRDPLWVRQLAGSTTESFPDGSTGYMAEFRGCDGVFIPAYLRKPKGHGPFPMVVVQHGGAPGEDVTYKTGKESPPAQAFSAAGWAVLATDFRHRTLPGGGVLEWHDGLAAVEAVRQLSYVDAGRIAVMGGSHGAHMLSEVVVRTKVRCAVLCSPAIFDLIELAKARDQGTEEVEPIKNAITEGEKRYGATIDVVAKNPELYGYESPLTEAAKTRCPVLIMNGRNDTSSPVMVMEVYRDKLRAAGIPVETYFPDNAPHGFYFGISHPPCPEETAESARRATAFIKKHFA